MTMSMPEGVRLDRGAGGLSRLTVNTGLCAAEIYTLGAHVCRWQPAGHPHPVLWMSGRSWFEAGRPIRGGVPICFPWFGPKAGNPQAPGHGVARLQEWAIDEVRAEADGAVTVRLSLASNDASRALFDGSFSLRYAATFGGTLDLALAVVNEGGAPFTLEEALHTYLAVSDARRIRVTGLGGAEYIDKTDGMKRKRQPDEAIAIAAETDRLYLDTTSPVTLDDPGFGRRIVIAKAGSRSTVVWNPWVAKSAAMPDFGDDEWPAMTCVETANAAGDAITLAPGGRQTMTATISVEPATPAPSQSGR